MDELAHTRIFIVDDVAAMRERLREYVEEIGDVDVVGEAATPADAIEGIRETKPDVVLLDYQLEGGTGVDVLCAIRKSMPQTVVAVLTNHAASQYRRACIEAGADHFFDKTADLDALRQVITLRRRGRILTTAK